MSEDVMPQTVELVELADELLAELPSHAAGRTARTVLNGSVMRAVVIALRDGAEMAEHVAPPAATMYVIRGEVTLRTSEHSWRVRPGQLVPVPPQKHAVEAHADSAVLLTVSLR